MAMAEPAVPFGWVPGAEGWVGVVPRGGDGSLVRWFRVDPCLVTHVLGAWEEGGGHVGRAVRGRRRAALPTSCCSSAATTCPRPGNPSIWRPRWWARRVSAGPRSAGAWPSWSGGGSWATGSSGSSSTTGGWSIHGWTRPVRAGLPLRLRRRARHCSWSLTFYLRVRLDFRFRFRVVESASESSRSGQADWSTRRAPQVRPRSGRGGVVEPWEREAGQRAASSCGPSRATATTRAGS